MARLPLVMDKYIHVLLIKLCGTCYRLDSALMEHAVR